MLQMKQNVDQQTKITRTYFEKEIAIRDEKIRQLEVALSEKMST